MNEPEFHDEYEEYRKHHPPFDPVVDALLDETTPFPATYLHRFSDLSENDLGKLKRIWNEISLVRRRALLEDLEELLVNDTLVSFEALGTYLLRDDDPHTRVMAIRLLWEEESHVLGSVFRDMLLHDPDPEVRATAANGLGYYVYAGELEEIPAGLLHDIEEALLGAFKNEDTAEVRRRALESLGFSSRPEVTPLIEAAARADTPDWVVSAIFAMGRSANQRWDKVVLDYLDDPNGMVRLEAARAAGELELHSALDQLLRIAQEDEEDDARLIAWWSLSQLGGEGVREALETALENSEDGEESDLLEEALENLSFTEQVGLFDLLDYDAAEEEMIEEDLDPASAAKKKHRHKKGKGE